jgi:CRP-like cAMP-binding protein
MNSESRPAESTELELVDYGDKHNETIAQMLLESLMFETLNKEDCGVLSNYFQAYRAHEGTTIITEGESDQTLYLLVEGTLDVNKKSESNTSKHLVIVMPGRTIGEMALIDQKPHSATVSVIKDCLLLKLSRDNLDLLAANHPITAYNFIFKIAELMSIRLRMTSEKLVDYL